MIRILHVLETLTPYGGTPVKLLSLAENSDGTQYKHLFFCHGKIQDSHKRYFNGILDIWNIERGALDIRTVTDIIDLIRKQNIDIVCTHFQRAHIYGRVAAILTGTPCIAYEHGLVPEKRQLVNLVNSLLDLGTSRIICNSEATAKSMDRKRVFIFDKGRKIQVVYNGVRDPALNDLKGNNALFKKHERSVRIAYIGGFIDLRDHKTLIEAFDNIIRQTRHKADLYLIGDGPGRQAVLDLIQARGLTRLVHILGYRKNAAQLLRDIDIYVNPCIQEGFGMATVEAMFFKKPVILARTGALTELAEEGKSALYFKPGNSQDLTEKLCILLESSKKRSQLGKHSWEWAHKRFNIHRYIQDISVVFDSVANI